MARSVESITASRAKVLTRRSVGLGKEDLVMASNNKDGKKEEEKKTCQEKKKKKRPEGETKLQKKKKGGKKEGKKRRRTRAAQSLGLFFSVEVIRVQTTLTYSNEELTVCERAAFGSTRVHKVSSTVPGNHRTRETTRSQGL